MLSHFEYIKLTGPEAVKNGPKIYIIVFAFLKMKAVCVWGKKTESEAISVQEAVFGTLHINLPKSVPFSPSRLYLSLSRYDRFRQYTIHTQNPTRQISIKGWWLLALQTFKLLLSYVIFTRWKSDAEYFKTWWGSQALYDTKVWLGIHTQKWAHLRCFGNNNKEIKGGKSFFQACTPNRKVINFGLLKNLPKNNKKSKRYLQRVLAFWKKELLKGKLFDNNWHAFIVYTHVNSWHQKWLYFHTHGSLFSPAADPTVVASVVIFFACFMWHSWPPFPWAFISFRPLFYSRGEDSLDFSPQEQTKVSLRPVVKSKDMGQTEAKATDIRNQSVAKAYQKRSQSRFELIPTRRRTRTCSLRPRSFTAGKNGWNGRKGGTFFGMGSLICVPGFINRRGMRIFMGASKAWCFFPRVSLQRLLSQKYIFEVKELFGIWLTLSTISRYIDI